MRPENWLELVCEELACCPGLCGSVGWSIVSEPKGCGFDSQSQNMSRLWVWFLVRMCTISCLGMCRRQPVDASRSLALMFFFFCSLSLKSNEKISSGEDEKNPTTLRAINL